jgi:serine/threonine-protein kinase CHEK1
MDGCRIRETLASGSTSRIKKFVTLDNEEQAVKIIPRSKVAQSSFVREVRIHKSLSHPNIVRYINSYEDRESYYLVMKLGENEMASVIEANVGLDPVAAHFYFVQLVSAVRYLHAHGICHRDIKPENVLLDRSGNLLLSDFGSSTLFCYKGKRRRLQTLAGTFEYMAPEVIRGDYEGDMADVWSCGIFLTVLLTGITPWNKAVVEDERYSAFVSMDYHYYPPFTKMRGQIVGLVERMLAEEDRRITMDQIQNSSWYRQENRLLGEERQCRDPHELLTLISQPDTKDLHFTQPNQMQREAESRFILSQPLSAAGSAPSIYRLYKGEAAAFVIQRACDVLGSMAVPHEAREHGIVFSTTDARRLPLVGEVGVKEVGGQTSVTLHRTKGDFHEFKRFAAVFTGLLK